MTKEEKLAVLDSLAEATRLGDLDMMARYITPDLVVHEDGGMPYGGVYRGAAGFLEMIGKIVGTVKDMNIERLRVFDGEGDDIAVTIRFTGTSIETGAPFEAKTCEIYTIVEGRLAELWVWYWDTPTIRKGLENA